MRKMKRGYYITDEAFLAFQTMAESEGQKPGPYMERVIRDLAAQRLSAEQRAEIKRRAEQLTAQVPALEE